MTDTPYLSWKNKHKPPKSPNISPRCIEYSSVENPRTMIHLYQGDNKSISEYLLNDFQGRINLIYVDPPFDSDANYERTIRLRGTKTPYQARKTQYTDQWDSHEYLQFIYERLFSFKDLLAENGLIYLHADWHRIHHLRLIFDEIFGENNFLNEIIWHHDFGGRSPHFLARKHDNLLLYKKGKQWRFNVDSLPDLPYKGNLHRYRGKQNKKGKKPTAVWNDLQGTDFVWDIAYENKMSAHNTGYPTQKPLALLHRLIELSSEPEDWILDPFLGSGTTAVSAHRLGRNLIGIDANWDSLHTTRTRLLHEDPTSDIHLYQSDIEEIFSPLELEYTLQHRQLLLTFSCPDIQEYLAVPNSIWKDLDWRTWIQSISIDWNGNANTLKNPLVDAPLSRKTLVQGTYPLPQNLSLPQTITLEATDILCRSKRFRILLAPETQSHR